MKVHSMLLKKNTDCSVKIDMILYSKGDFSLQSQYLHDDNNDW